MTSRVSPWLATIIPIVLVTMGCASDDDSNNDNEPNGGEHSSTELKYTAVLDDTVHRVILPTYAELKNNAAGLQDAVETLKSDPTADNLAAARTAWQDAREPWETSEAFLFGPVAHLGLDPALDTWPVDRVQLDQVTASDLELTPDNITENLGGGLKGFHTIEYLLWGVDGTTTAEVLADAPRDMEYLVAATQALAVDAAVLHDSWAPDADPDDDIEGGFGEGFALSGQEGGLYFSQQDAMQQLVNGMVDICDEVANGKIADPYDEQDTELVESQFSFNSILDFTNNIRSVQHAYQGIRGSEGVTVSDTVAERDADLDDRVKNEIQAAMDAIQAISPNNDPPFRDALSDPDKAELIESAQRAIRTVMDTLAGDVMAVVVQ